MTLKQRWILPEGIDELLPDQAERLELLRRKLLDMMRSWGYQLVFPPLVEYLDSLLTGTAKTLDLQTFKITDQLSGRLMGIRADMTPQVARIAAHQLRESQQILRLCYIGNVLQTLPQTHGSSRNPIQLGAEIYGHAGPDSDLEILQLMVEVLTTVKLGEPILIDLGHVGIYRSLAAYAGLNAEQEQALFTALQRKAIPDITQLLSEYQLAADAHAMLLALSELNGDIELLHTARTVLSQAPEAVHEALDNLQTISERAMQRLPGVILHFDLAELRGYHYHTGLVFAAYQSGSAQAIAMGGRYDDIGEDFGYAQPATGFSLDLKQLVMQTPDHRQKQPAIYHVWSDDEKAQQKVQALRQQGEVVIYQYEDDKQ